MLGQVFYILFFYFVGELISSCIHGFIPGSVIGVINIYDKFTFVEVPKDIAEKVISVMHRNTIKGYKLNIEPAKGK